MTEIYTRSRSQKTGYVMAMARFPVAFLMVWNAKQERAAATQVSHPLSHSPRTRHRSSEATAWRKSATTTAPPARASCAARTTYAECGRPHDKPKQPWWFRKHAAATQVSDSPKIRLPDDHTRYRRCQSPKQHWMHQHWEAVLLRLHLQDRTMQLCTIMSDVANYSSICSTAKRIRAIILVRLQTARTWEYNLWT